MKKEDCTVLVCSCDNYEDAWEPFFKLFHEYWTNCPLEILLNTESKKYCYKGLNIRCLQKFKGKKVPYGERMIAHLKEIHTPFTLVLMDDFFIRDFVNEGKLDKVIEWMKNDPKVAVFSFQSIKDELNRPSKKYEGYSIRPVYGEYKFNFQAAIWRTDYLLHSWKKHETPWEWETVANFRSFNKKYDFYTLQNDDDTPINYGFQNSGMGIFRGKWVKDSVVQLFEEHNIHVDYDKRGFYENKDKDIVRMKKGTGINNVIRTIRSYGLWLYIRIFIWRIVRQIQMKFGRTVPKDYIDYKRKQIKKKALRFEL